jgi:site-specific recombinase XerD
MRQALDTMARMMTHNTADGLSINWASLRYQHTVAIRAQLAERYQAATANKMLCALRGVLKQAWRLGLISAEDYQKARDVDSISGETIPAGRELLMGEITALLTNCEMDPTPAGARDAAIIALLYAGGLRREEVTRLNLEGYEVQTGRLVVHGKRNKDRTAYLMSGAAMAMRDWLAVRGTDPGPLFWPINKGGRLINRRITNQAVYNLLAKRAELAGVK